MSDLTDEQSVKIVLMGMILPKYLEVMTFEDQQGRKNINFIQAIEWAGQCVEAAFDRFADPEGWEAKYSKPKEAHNE